MQLFVKYESTFYWDYLASPMPVFTKEFGTVAEAIQFISDPKNEVVKVIEIFEGKNRSDLIETLNKAVPNG